MSPSNGPLVSIALPVYNGADTVAPVVESVLAQTHPDLELVISDNASTDGTQEICRQFARDDRRVVYRRHRDERRPAQQLHQRGGERTRGPTCAGSATTTRSSRTTSRACLDVFAEDERRVVVTTQIVYTDADGVETLDTDYDPAALASADPVERFAEMLRLLTSRLRDARPALRR